GDQYTGLDRFGQIVDQRWIKTSDGSHTDRFKYGYDRNGNRLFRENVLNAVFSELYHADGAGAGYDNLDQLLEFQRGTLSDTNSDNIPDTVTNPTRQQGWTLDAQGNWSSLNTDGSGVNRTHNKQNQVTAVGSANLTYDANGNMTTDEFGKPLVFDAWNRLVQVKSSGGATIATYKYDALSRRIVETVSGTTRDMFFSAAWQVVEEREGSTVKLQYVWSPVYVDALVLRDRDADGNSGNGLEERLYVQHDANFNATALINTSGSVVERYVYDPYGTVTLLSSAWSTLSNSAYDWDYLHQGRPFETGTGLYDFRVRPESPSLGRFPIPDPIAFKSGDPNFYRFVFNSATNLTDPSGLQVPDPRSLPNPGQLFDPPPQQLIPPLFPTPSDPGQCFTRGTPTLLPSPVPTPTLNTVFPGDGQRRIPRVQIVFDPNQLLTDFEGNPVGPGRVRGAGGGAGAVLTGIAIRLTPIAAAEPGPIADVFVITLFIIGAIISNVGRDTDWDRDDDTVIEPRPDNGNAGNPGNPNRPPPPPDIPGPHPRPPGPPPAPNAGWDGINGRWYHIIRHLFE
ncbi:MAG: hypothetical protein L0Y72_32075, partial [Gemmataceae bacterium]|nr:hypothetical protein [Gemmataceae bacterium]MCI0743693.1 hypothetical protein [Gemmataceae bacterium]